MPSMPPVRSLPPLLPQPPLPSMPWSLPSVSAGLSGPLPPPLLPQGPVDAVGTVKMAQEDPRLIFKVGFSSLIRQEF